MSLFSSLRKNKQESSSDNGAFFSRAEEESKAVRNSRTRRRQGSQGSTADDPVLPEKKRARRRLIGAVALVLAAVIGLPMILDSEPKPLADDLVIRIPSKDKAAPVDSPRPAADQQVSSLDPKEEVIEPPPVAEAKPQPGKPQAADEAAATDAVKARDAGKSDAVLEKPADKANNVSNAAKPAATAKAETEDRADDAARAKALLEGKPDPKAADGKTGKFVIQVAALASKEKVDELQGKLRQAGIKSYTQKIATQSGERTRIRVGPFASKEEAEKVRARIVKLGLGGSVVPA